MKMRIAFFAACAGTLAIAPVDVALAFGASSQSMGLSITGGASEPVIRLAQSAPVNTSRSNKKAGKAECCDALGQVSTTRGRKAPTGKPVTGSGSRSSKTVESRGEAMMDVSTTRGRKVPAGKGSGLRSSKQPECCSGTMLDVATTRGRKIKPAKTGKGAIFDRWGSTTGEVISY